MNKALRVPDYLDHILEAIERIEDYTSDVDEVGFLSDRMVQDAVIRNFEIIGEASNNIQRVDPAFAAQHAHLPLSSAYQMRNAVAHGYFKIDLEVVWSTIQNDLPELYRQIKAVRQTLAG